MASPVFLRNLWYFALPARQLPPGSVLGRVFLGEPILFGRTTSGKAFALRDICPHRGIPLSYGKMLGEELMCCYHGWRFNPGGQCTHIPSLCDPTDLDISRINVPSYPVREVQGNLWIYLGEESDPQVPIPLVPGDPNQRPQLSESFDFPCYVDHAIVGLMDPAHGPFVHQVWWWRSRGELFVKSKQFDPLPLGFVMRRHRLLKTSFFYRLLGANPETEIQFHLPGVRIEIVQGDRHQVTNLTTVTPISAQQTQVISQFYWSHPGFTLAKPILRWFMRTFFEQDRQVVIKQQDGLKYNPALMLIKDADTQARWYHQIKQEYARSVLEKRPFVNPLSSQVLRWRS
ncbi:aromatic ring-hydroxylating dioxygenase subunit alpha [Synechococcus sp. C9]|uniref:aromatic ring-hydroxylating oxygenase subunit alpha n=1 Tax=Synechococcus sp. C9 TaxID=102119 RepID=UPI001FF3E2CF|nr:aromatic ring-hydroxylating dioxygenase subunit alpha [Synechococcus sp. C9]